MGSKHIVLAVALSVGGASAAWCADEPAQPTASQGTQPAGQEAAAASSAADDEAAKAAAAKEKKAAEADADDKRLLSRGYKKETHGGQTLYCRFETKMGSRFETKQCGTAASIMEAEQAAKDIMQNSRRATNGSK